MGKFSLLAALGILALLAVTHAMPKSGSDSSAEESAEAREKMEESSETRTFIREIRTMCRNNSGSDEAYIALTEAVGTAIVCVMTSVDVKHFISDVETISNATRGTFFPKYCPQLKRTSSCLDDLVEALKPCLTKHSLTNVLALTGMYPDAVDLFCKNEGEIFSKLTEPTTKECLYELRDNVMECTVPFSGECANWNFSNLTQTQFGAISGLRQCMEDKLDDCEAPDIMSVYDVFHNQVFRLASCRNVRPFLEDGFIFSVKYMSLVMHNESNTVNEN